MSIDAHCDEAQERLTDAAFEGREVSKADRLHTDECERCRAHRADLVALTQMLDFTPPLSVERAAAVRRNVALELTRSAPDTRRATAGADLPREYPRELARILAWAAIPLPLVLFIYLQLFRLGGALLSEFLPQLAVNAVGAAAALCAASWLALVYGSIPFVAHHKVSSRQSEVSP